MTNTKTTKRALLSSVMAMLLCFTMLLGTTFAWFTDSVTSGNNIIKSGNLDIELEYWNGTAWADVKDASDILTNTFWEPGVTEVAYLRIANAGSLVLKYQFGINILNEIDGKNQKNETFKLSDYIMFGVVENVNGETGAYAKDDAGRAAAIAAVTDEKKISAGYTKASTMKPDEELYLALVVYMPTDTDNVANHNGTDVPQIALGINVFATQVGAELDSFGPDYDKDASAFVSSVDELKDAIANVKDGGTVYLNAGTYEISSQLDIDGKSINIVGLGDATVKLTRSGQKAFYIYGSQVEGNTGIDVTISNIKIDGNSAKSDIWVRTWPNSTRGDVNLTLNNVTCTSVIADNNYSDNTIINIDVQDSKIGKITLDASPFNNNGHVTSTNLTYDAASRIDSINIQDGAAQALNNITINGVNPTATGEQQSLTYVDTTEELQTALDNAEDGDTIIVSAGTYDVINVTKANCNVALVAADGAVVKLAGINGQSNNTTTNLTVKDITIDNTLVSAGWYTGTSQNMKPCVGVWGGDYTFENCTFYVSGESKAETGVMSWWTTNAGTMTFENCIFNGGSDSARAMQIYGEYNLNVEGCTFNTAKDYSIKYVGSENLTATFKNNIVNNTVNFVQTGSAPYAGEDYTLVFENNTLANGINHVYVDNDENQIIIINGKRWVGSATQLAAAVAKGETDIYLLDGEYDVYGCGGKTLTLSGSRTAVIKIINEGEDGCDYGFDGATVTFNGVTFDTTANTGNYKGYARMTATFNDCAFFGAYTTHLVQTFNDCTFDFNNGYLWIWGATEVSFNDCEFGGNSKAILAHGDANTVITINNCDFVATEKGYTGSGDNTAAVEIDPTGTNTYTINFIGENTKTDSYSGWTRVKDGSTGHTVTGLN